MCEGDVECSICHAQCQCFDGSGFFGSGSVQAVCPDCLSCGRLIEMDIETNEVNDRRAEAVLGQSWNDIVNVVCHMTPALPTWQDNEWPLGKDDLCVFVKIADRHDFTDKDELIRSIPDDLRFGHSSADFWGMLPDKKITSIADGNYDVSFYLFDDNGSKVVTWDCN
jgi:uncharacterized protein CbrC (UPF0167 family)